MGEHEYNISMFYNTETEEDSAFDKVKVFVSNRTGALVEGVPLFSNIDISDKLDLTGKTKIYQRYLVGYALLIEEEGMIFADNSFFKEEFEDLGEL
jgi:hypothetical protein